LTASSRGGEIEASVEKHRLTSRAAGVEHNVMNKSNSHELAVVPRNASHRLRVEGRAVVLVIDAIKG